jgi:hypothetical protein
MSFENVRDKTLAWIWQESSSFQKFVRRWMRSRPQLIAAAKTSAGRCFLLAGGLGIPCRAHWRHRGNGGR